MKIYCIYCEEESNYPEIIACYKTYAEAVAKLKELKEKYEDLVFSYNEDELVLDNDDLYMIIETELKE